MSYDQRKTTSTSTSTSTGASTQLGPVSPDQGNEAARDEVKREIYQRTAQDVVDQSNADQEDTVWAAMNGGNEGVDKDAAQKPDAWYRGIKLENESATPGEDGFYDYTPAGVHGDTAGVDSMDEVRAMLQSDLSYNEVFDKFESCDQFIDALVQRYARDMGTQHPRTQEVVAIGENLWSYGHTGADLTGRTNIGELQGMLYSLDALIAEASETNTPNKGSFTVPGSDVELATLGDGIYGRASILECRLLAAVLSATPTPTEITEVTPEPEPIPGTETHLIVDFSGTMINHGHWERVAELMDELDVGPTRLATMTDYADPLQWATAEFQDPEAVRELLETASAAYRDAGGAHAGRSALEEMPLPEGTNPDLFTGDSNVNESSIHMALKTLTDEDVVAGQQIVVATDEKDSKPDELRALRDQAIARGVEVKVLFYSGSGGLVPIEVNRITDELLDLLDRRMAARREGLLTKGVPVEERKSVGSHEVERLDWKAVASDPRYVGG